MPRRGWRRALFLAAEQLIRRSDPQEARRYLVQEWRCRRKRRVPASG